AQPVPAVTSSADGGGGTKNLPFLIGGAVVVILLIVGAVVLLGGGGGDTETADPVTAGDTGEAGDTGAGGADSEPDTGDDPTTATEAETTTSTSTSTTTSTTTTTTTTVPILDGVPCTSVTDLCIDITGVSLDAAGELVIDWTSNFVPNINGGNHGHFFWSDISPVQAGAGGGGVWDISDQQPFVVADSGLELLAANRPAGADVCVTVGQPDHTVRDAAIFQCWPYPG
ncbi:MAG: hypothetical protein ACE5GB_14815, partial [Acidimicrobiales bacterium]